MFLPALIIQTIVYLLIFLVDDYAGSLLSLILGSICLAVWGISLLVEWVSPSRVKKSYYRLVLTGWLAPLLAFISFTIAKGGLDWLS